MKRFLQISVLVLLMSGCAAAASFKIYKDTADQSRSDEGSLHSYQFIIKSGSLQSNPFGEADFRLSYAWNGSTHRWAITTHEENRNWMYVETLQLRIDGAVYTFMPRHQSAETIFSTMHRPKDIEANSIVADSTSLFDEVTDFTIDSSVIAKLAAAKSAAMIIDGLNGTDSFTFTPAHIADVATMYTYAKHHSQ